MRICIVCSMHVCYCVLYIYVFELMQYPKLQTYFQVSSLIWYTYECLRFVISELSLIRANIKEKCLGIQFGIKWAINIVHSKFEIDVEKTVKQS